MKNESASGDSQARYLRSVLARQNKNDTISYVLSHVFMFSRINFSMGSFSMIFQYMGSYILIDKFLLIEELNGVASLSDPHLTS